MSERSCPASGLQGGGQGCPVSSASRSGPRGCAFIAHQMSAQSHYNPNGTLADGRSTDALISEERKTITELLIPEAPPRSVTHGLANADGLNPPDLDVLASALGAPARQVLNRAQDLGPRTGWRDGYLTSSYGFCPPDPSAAPIALAMSAGRVWSDLCERMPAVVARGKMRESVLALPLVFGTVDVIPDAALWAAMVCLGILASVYRYEERNDGSEGISVAAPPGTFRNLSGEADDEEEETKGIPRNIAIPLRQISTRMGRVLPHLTQYDVSVYNYKLRDPTSVLPYVARCENMDLRWPVFNDRGEAMFLLAMAETHGCFVRGVELITRCQEMVMLRDKEGLLRDLINLKGIVDQFAHVFQKISVNPRAGEFFGNPVEASTVCPQLTATANNLVSGVSDMLNSVPPLSKRVPALSGLALPVFLLMDAFIGRNKYETFLGKEALHLRAWLPLNIRAFIAAIEYHYQIPTFVKDSGDPRLLGVWEGLIEAYIGERGWFGTHRYKVYGFLEVVAKTGRSETNGNSGSSDNAGRPWEEVHKTLSDSMRERLEPYRGKVTLQPHELRGSFEECRFKARIISRSAVDFDPTRSTGMVTFGLEDTGITFQPGDRLAIMPVNSWTEVNKISAALGLDDFLHKVVPVSQTPEWARFANHIKVVNRSNVDPSLTVQDILRRGHVAPLTKDIVMALHMTLRASSSSILKVLGSDTWPVQCTVGDLLQLAICEVPAAIWDQEFDLSDLSWLPKLFPVEVPRTYSISNHSNELLPSTVDLTVSRNEYRTSASVGAGATSSVRYGVSSCCLNPEPGVTMVDDEEYLIGISRPLNFQLPVTMTGPIAMFAGGSGIAPFRGFWQARARSSAGRNILFLGVQSRQRFSYEHELREYVREGHLELHTAFSRDSNGLFYDPMSRDLIEKSMKPRYLNETITEQGRTVCDMVVSKSQGGLGGHLFVCGSLSMYDTIMSGIRQAIYQNWTSTKESADELLAKAFAERRFMLDIFMTPQPVSYAAPQIPISKLALHTGHRKGSRMWIGVHGGVYDITDFLPIHPGGTFIAQASAGLDASKTFDDLAHTSNPEVTSLLSKYFIGHLASKPDFRSLEISSLYDLWHAYLHNSVESLTTLYFEVNHIMNDSSWFQGGLFDMARVRKFYQFQSRLMQNGFSSLFGAKLQELHLKLTYALVNSVTAVKRIPDVIGIITRAQASSASAAAANEISQIGQFVCSSLNAQLQENGVLRYAKTATELDVQFLEEIRQDLCMGMDAFDVVKSSETASMSENHRLVNLSAYLLSVLERVAQRLETFFSRLARESIYRPDIEKNPAKTRWNVLRRKVYDGSFFVLAQGTKFDASRDVSLPFRSTKNLDHDIPFIDVVSQAQQAVGAREANRNWGTQSRTQPRPRRLADSHTARAAVSATAPSSHELQQSRSALQSIAVFMDANDQSIKRLSRLPTNIGLDEIMAAYGASGGPNERKPPVPEKEIASTLERQLQRQTGSQDSSATSKRQATTSREASPEAYTPRLIRRGTNRSITSGVGLPSRPSPGSHSSIHPTHAALPKPISVSSVIPLPLVPTSRSRESSRTRRGSLERLHRRQMPYEVDRKGAAPNESQDTLVMRKGSAASPQGRLITDLSRSQSPLSVSSRSQNAHFEMLHPTPSASNRLNEQVLAQMQRENEMILNANSKTSSEAASTMVATMGQYDGGNVGMKAFKMVPHLRSLVQT